MMIGNKHNFLLFTSNTVRSILCRTRKWGSYTYWFTLAW